MTTTYHDIVEEALAAEDIREYNVVALGDGENLHDDLVLTDDDTATTYQARLEAELGRRIDGENREQHAEAAAKHAAIMATITKIVTETAPRGNVQKRRVWGLLDDMIL